MKILTTIARVYELQSQLEEAEKTYQKCIEFNNYQIFIYLANLQFKMGKLRKGIENL